jgi:hypothetical protein
MNVQLGDLDLQGSGKGTLTECKETKAMKVQMLESRQNWQAENAKPLANNRVLRSGVTPQPHHSTWVA